MARPPSADSILKKMKPRAEQRTAIASDMFIPNHSGDHSAGTTGTPTNDLDISNKKYVDDNKITDYWKTTTSQTGLTGDKTGSFDLTTTGTITGEQLTSTDDITMSGLLTNTMGASDSKGMFIDGDTNAFTGAVSNTVNDIKRTIGSSGGSGGFTSISTKNQITNNYQSTGSILLGSFLNSGLDNTVIATGSHSSSPTLLLEEKNYGMRNIVSRSGTISSAKTTINNIAANSTIISNIDFNSAGNTLDVENIGQEILITSDEREIDGTLNILNKGLNIEISAPSSGTSINYGIYISSLQGADTNWGFYNNTAVDNFMGLDNSVTMWGTTNTDLQISSDGTNGIIDVATALRIGNITTNYTEISSTGDLVFVGSSGLCYGEISVNSNTTETAITTSGKANKVQYTLFDTDGESNNTTPDNTTDDITITKAGRYLINVSIHADSISGAGALFGFSIWKNNGATELTNLSAHRDFSGGGSETGSITMSGIANLSVNDTLELWLWNQTNTQNLILNDVTFSIVQIGG